MKGCVIGRGEPLRTAQTLQQLIPGIHKIVFICLDSMTGALKSDGEGFILIAWERRVSVWGKLLNVFSSFLPSLSGHPNSDARKCLSIFLWEYI